MYDTFLSKLKHKYEPKNFNINDKIAHNASYDAFMTGFCFLEMNACLPNISQFRNNIKMYSNDIYSIRLDQ